MPYVLIRPPWHLPERLVTPEAVYRNRRQFLRELGLVGAGALAWSLPGRAAAAAAAPYPAKRNPAFSPDWKLTAEEAAISYNNFYEFSTNKNAVRHLVARFQTSPWTVQISGLIEKPMTVTPDELIAEFGLEERIYRFRCVEAWAMIVPWTGFPMSKLIEKVKPKPEARFVRFETFNRPDEAPGMADPRYPWPYHEGLRLDEARHPLTLLATGLYGKPLPKQNGAPLRLVVPWKYGYKSIKSIVKIEFVATQPKTFWETILPHEYPFESNVNPKVPHPRWSQETERLIDSGLRVRTQLYNGYADQVAALYP
jgi:sulfoxide reductase catalytic subunit YedY